MIRRADFADIPDLVPLCRQFHAESLRSVGEFHEGDMQLSLREAVAHGIAFLAEEGGEAVGLIIGNLGPLIYNHAYSLAHEALWYIKPGYRGAGMALLDAYEAEALTRGAVAVCFFYLAGGAHEAALSRLAERRGYDRQGPVYMKVF